MSVAPRCIDVIVRSGLELDAALDEAVNLLKSAAITEKVGISVTRMAPGRYEARLNSGVPRGLTIECWADELA